MEAVQELQLLKAKGEKCGGRLGVCYMETHYIMEDQGEERGGWEKKWAAFYAIPNRGHYFGMGNKDLPPSPGGVRSGKYSGEKTGVGGDKAVMEVNWEGDEGEGGRGR